MSSFTAPVVVLVAVLGAPRSAPGQVPRPAEPAVEAANAAVLTTLPFADRQDFEDATRGFLGTTPDARTPPPYQFLQQPVAPATVNPSLWRLAQLNALNGLYRISTSSCTTRACG